MMKKFSVLIVHYNNFEYFKACYQSLMNQSFDDFEVIIVKQQNHFLRKAKMKLQRWVFS
ncbi:MAG: glycosyltransferase family 2 protein [Chryseobacterium sp.]|nr:glycosyltransferase family 2 protein [Chryseobacterium sp.]